MNTELNKMTSRVMACMMAILLVAGTPLWSQNQPDFTVELSQLLASEGWTAEQVRELVTQDVEWEQAEEANPEVVSLALRYALEQDEEMPPMTQAMLALDVATAAIEMEALGIDEATVALTALKGVRDVLGDVAAFRESDGEMSGRELAERIRTRLNKRVATAARERNEERLQERGRPGRDESGEKHVPGDFSDAGSPGPDSP